MTISANPSVGQTPIQRTTANKLAGTREQKSSCQRTWKPMNKKTCFKVVLAALGMAVTGIPVEAAMPQFRSRTTHGGREATYDEQGRLALKNDIARMQKEALEHVAWDNKNGATIPKGSFEKNCEFSKIQTYFGPSKIGTDNGHTILSCQPPKTDIKTSTGRIKEIILHIWESGSYMGKKTIGMTTTILETISKGGTGQMMYEAPEDVAPNDAGSILERPSSTENPIHDEL